MKKMNNKGFSLVELIVVIAIMAVLVGVLAPQFIKYVENSRRSTDISTAEAIREAALADIADQRDPYVGTGATSITINAVTDCPSAVKTLPSVKSNKHSGSKFIVHFNAVTGTCDVEVDGYNLTDAVGAKAYKDDNDNEDTKGSQTWTAKNS